MSDDIMITTKDNPYNPFTQFDDWYSYDVSKGYNTCAYLARLTISSDELSEEDESLAIDSAIEDIISLNLLGNYIKVTPEDFKNKNEQANGT